MDLLPARAAFLLLSFEGPDRYAIAGGLGVRITHLARTIARRGYETHLLFVGDPGLPAKEQREEGRLTLHRWCQWISAYHSGGVYAGEEDKLRDFLESVPPFILEKFVRPVLASGRLPIILAEEWHTADAICRLGELLGLAGLAKEVVVFWNANNTMSFHRLDWSRLSAAAEITTVSRYMKHRMWGLGVNPLVIPNGIPTDLLRPMEDEWRQGVRNALFPDGDGVLLFKAGRFDPAKRWLMAVEATALLRDAGYHVRFPFSGGTEPHGAEVFSRARDLGLSIAEVTTQPETCSELLDILHTHSSTDLLHLRFFMTQDLLRPMYSAADAVLANSGHEPFGLVGLEAMAAEGVVFTGATGEDYAVAGESAIVLDTDQPMEIASKMQSLLAEPDRVKELRRAARMHAADFSWPKVFDILLDKIRFSARVRGGRGIPIDAGVPRARAVVVYTVVHQPRRLALPARPIPTGATAKEIEARLFDDEMNEAYFRKVARRCYWPAVERFSGLLDRGLRLAVGFSQSFLDQAERWDPDLLKAFRQLLSHEHAELVAVDPCHSFVLLFDTPRFVLRMRQAANRLEEIFGQRPSVADTTELMMSDTIYHALDQAGFKAGFLDGRPWVLKGRAPTRLYHHGGRGLKLFPRHHQLSDDVGYRFSDRGWECWPLTAARYAEWLAGCPGQVVVLGWDFETFGEHHPEESGIFQFLQALPEEVRRVGMEFLTPTEAIDRFGAESQELDLPAFASTWAGSGGLEFFLGNEAQQAVFQLMLQAYNMARLTGHAELIALAELLAQSDNLHLIQWFKQSGSDAEVSSYFTPKEWWELGPERIIWEIQQVYKNYIAALDPHLPGERSEEALRQGVERTRTTVVKGG